MTQQYAQMRRARYEAPQWLVEPGEIVEAYDVETMNTMVAQGELKEVWIVPIAGYAPYTHLARLFGDGQVAWHYLVVRE